VSDTDRTLPGAVAAADRHRSRLVAGLLAVALVLPVVVSSSLLYDLTVVFVYGLLAFAAVVPIGYAGQLILSQGAFFGVGAYTFVTLANAGVPGVLAVAVAVALTAAVAYVLGRPATRASGIYLGIITLAFNELFVIALDLFPSFTGGSTGLSSPALFPSPVVDLLPEELLYYYLLVAVYGATLVGVRHLLGSETGWAFLVIKENRTVAESIGVDTAKYRLLSFTLSGAICGLAGGLFAPLTGYLSPTVFDLHTSINIILAGLLGGLTVASGTLLGAGVVILVPRFLRAISDVRLVLYGTLLILLLVYLPQGIGGWIQERLD
jgi:branched-chain amino acid transport system permease protein